MVNVAVSMLNNKSDQLFSFKYMEEIKLVPPHMSAYGYGKYFGIKKTLALYTRCQQLVNKRKMPIKEL